MLLQTDWIQIRTDRSNILDLDQNQHSVGPDLGPNCLKRLSADIRVATSMERVKTSYKR